jgi:hypothetical protein
MAARTGKTRYRKERLVSDKANVSAMNNVKENLYAEQIRKR